MIQLLHDRILVTPIIEEYKSENAIIIPESVKSLPQKSVVVAVGPGTNGNKMELRPGDIVLHPKGNYEEIIINTKPHYFLRESNILYIL